MTDLTGEISLAPGQGYEATLRQHCAETRQRLASARPRAPLPLRVRRIGLRRTAAILEPLPPVEAIEIPSFLPVQLPPGRRILIEVAEKHGLTAHQIAGGSRRREIVEARHEAMFRMHRETTLSLPAIGRVFGGMDHTTVLHAVRKMEAREAAHR